MPTLVAPANATHMPLVEQLLALDSSRDAWPSQGMPVLPIWSASNGRLLAVVALPRAWANAPIDPTPDYAGPSTWRLAGSTLTANALAGEQWSARRCAAWPIPFDDASVLQRKRLRCSRAEVVAIHADRITRHGLEHAGQRP